MPYRYLLNEVPLKELSKRKIAVQKEALQRVSKTERASWRRIWYTYHEKNLPWFNLAISKEGSYEKTKAGLGNRY